MKLYHPIPSSRLPLLVVLLLMCWPSCSLRAKHDEEREWSLRSEDAVVYSWAAEGANHADGIVAVAADGSRRLDLVRMRGARAPDWSEAKRKLLFVADTEEGSQIFVLDPFGDNANPIRLTEDASPKDSPRWSPDGERILFTRKSEGGPELYIMNSDGRNARHLAPGMMPDWSPDGEQIVAVVGQIPQLQLIEEDGAEPRPLQNHVELRAYFYPIWSPGGRMIAYAVIAHADMETRTVNYDVLVTSLHDANVQRMQDKAGLEFPYAWAGDDRLLIASDEGGKIDLYFLDVGSGGRKKLTDDSRTESGADWAPGFFEDGVDDQEQ